MSPRKSLPCRIIERFVNGGQLAYDDLRDWIATLERAGELKRIRTEVDPILEIAEITDRVSKGNYRNSEGWKARATSSGPAPALLSQNVKGHPGSQVLINQFGSSRPMHLARGVDSLDQVAEAVR